MTYFSNYLRSSALQISNRVKAFHWFAWGLSLLCLCSFWKPGIYMTEESLVVSNKFLSPIDLYLSLEGLELHQFRATDHGIHYSPLYSVEDGSFWKHSLKTTTSDNTNAFLEGISVSQIMSIFHIYHRLFEVLSQVLQWT